jgi:mannosylglucosylglycerate synthase
MMPAAIDGPAGTRTIALVHYAAPPVVGGVEHVLAHHAVLLADAGHDVRIVAGRGRSPDPRVRFVKVPLLDPRHPDVERIQRVLGEGRVPDDFTASVAAIQALLVESLRDVDVVIAHNVCSLNLHLALTAALRRMADDGAPRRLVLWHHDLVAASPAQRDALHPGMPWDLLRTAWPGAIQVTISEERRQQLAALIGVAPDTIAVVPNGADTSRMWGVDQRTAERIARLGLPQADPLLLVPSRITPRKNIELALCVVAEMRRRGRPAAVLVTGPADPHHPDGDAYVERLLALRRSLSLEDAARFLSTEAAGPPTDAMMRGLYHLADALFLPSREEGFGIPIVEAALCRLPIACTGLPTLRRLAGDAAVYFGADDDPARVADGLLRLVDADPVGRLAHRIRAEYGWAAIYRERIAPLIDRS